MGPARVLPGKARIIDEIGTIDNARGGQSSSLTSPERKVKYPSATWIGRVPTLFTRVA